MSGVSAIVALAILGAIAGTKPGERRLEDLLAGLWATIQRPSVLLALVAATLLWLVYAFRRVLLWRKAVAPGPILVGQLENATRQQEVPVRDLAIRFQQHLSLVNLAASAVPGAAPAAEFIQLLKQTEFDVKRPFGIVGGVLGLVVPSHAYEAKVTLLERSAKPSFGVAVEMTLLPRRLTTFHRHWEESWERALERAAHAVAAEVLPRTRQCRGPWAAWYGRQLPDELFDQYQQARTKLGERRFEEALGHYYAALRLDPGNPDIGYELGLAQEKLGLWLDALLTCHRVFTADRDTQLRRRPHALPGRRVRRRVDLLARDRYVSLLGFGERLARQWITTGDRPGPAGYVARDAERSNLRWQLRAILSSRYASLDPHALAAIGLEVRETAPRKRRALVRNELKRLLADPTPGGGKRQEARRRQEAELLVLFEVLAEHEARTLLRDTRFQILRRLNTPITRTSLQITNAWATRRRERVEGKPLAIGHVDEKAAYRQLFGRWVAWKLRRTRNYTAHYDAACSFAIPLLKLGRRGGRASGPDRQAAIAYAVRELHLAVDNARGEIMATRWDWIVSEDPDLAELRKTREFRAFESGRLPSMQSPPLRPTDVQHLELARHTSGLVSTVARRLEREWHDRAERADAKPTVDVHEIQDWWGEEVGSWDALGQFALNHRDWRTRLDWIRRMQAFAVRHQQPPYISRHPLYADDEINVGQLSGGESQLDDAAIRRVKASTTRMHRLHALLAERLGELHDGRDGQSWRRILNELDERGETLTPAELRRLCHGRAALWAGAAMWFEATVASREAVDDAALPLVSALDHLPLPAPLP